MSRPLVAALSGSSYAPEDERQFIDAFAPQVIAAARQEGFTCGTVTFAMADLRQDSMLSTARPSLNRCAFFIKLSTHYLRTDSPVELAGTLAHELGHVINGDWTQAGLAWRRLIGSARLTRWPFVS
jgi:Zn-dependent protease with chaperone function